MSKIYPALSFLACLACASPSAHAAEPAKVVTTEKGPALADQKGMTLYVFDKDAAGKSHCAASCATNWPPFMADAGSAPSNQWSVIDRSDGRKQWAYGGKPLYTYLKDAKPGDVTGDGVGGS